MQTTKVRLPSRTISGWKTERKQNAPVEGLDERLDVGVRGVEDGEQVAVEEDVRYRVALYREETRGAIYLHGRHVRRDLATETEMCNQATIMKGTEIILWIIVLFSVLCLVMFFFRAKCTEITRGRDAPLSFIDFKSLGASFMRVTFTLIFI